MSSSDETPSHLTTSHQLLEPALPKLKEAHHLMWQVREVCDDETMRKALGKALRHNRAAQRVMNDIQKEVRDADLVHVRDVRRLRLRTSDEA